MLMIRCTRWDLLSIWFPLLILVCCCFTGTATAEPDDLDDDDGPMFVAPTAHMGANYDSNQRDDQLGDDTLRGCECWRWPECVSNCTVNPILQDQLRTDHLLLAHLPRPFVLVFPYQDRKLRSKYGTSTAGKRGTYYMNTKFWIHLPNREHVQLKLQKSRIFGSSNDYSTLYFQRNNEGQLYGYESNKLDHCFYTGTVRHEPNQFEPDTYVAVDTCHGLRGVIQTVNQTYGVLPLKCTQCQHDRLPHVVFPHQPSPIDRDARLPVFWQPFDVLATKVHGMKKVGEQQYTVRLTVILDHQLFIAFDQNLEQCMHYVGSVVNLATKSFQGLPVELRLVRSEIWNMEDHIRLNVSIKTTLNNLAVYTTSRVRVDSPARSTTLINSTASEDRRNRAWHRFHRRAAILAPEPVSINMPPVQPLRTNTMETRDVEILLTATQFTDVVEYLAIPDSVCTPRALAVIQVNTSETLYHVSRLVSLAIAEVLGMKSFPCPPLFSCSSPDLFSEGDKARIRLALVSGMADCLIPNTAQEAARFWSDTCGNGKLDRGEECDPSSIPLDSRSRTPTSSNMTRDLLPCCNPTTCLADVGAVCTHGACCDRCQLASRGKVCRMARDLCDLPEFCTGSEPTCPADLYLENGSPCRTQAASMTHSTQTLQMSNQSELDEGRALCYQGRCPTRDSQCETIWGVGATRAAEYCFMVHNTKTAGACGVLGENCKSEHALCGLLHCQGGKPRPVSVGAGQPFLTYTEHRGEQFECKHLSHTSTVRFVPEGAACGPKQYCFHQQCVPPNVALRSRCPSGPVNQHTEDGRIVVRNVTCSDRGLCTNAGFCFCRPGWSGNACQDAASVNPLLVATTRTGSASRNILGAPSPLQPDADIAKRIWTQLEAMQRPDYRPEMEYPDGNRKEKTQLNTLYLVVILASVVGGTFLILTIFMLIYRRRGQSRFPRKRTRSRCLPLSRTCKRSDHRSCPYDPKGNGSLRLYETGVEGHDLQFALSPMRARGFRPVGGAGDDDGFDYNNSSYLARWSHERRSRRHRKRRSRDPDYLDSGEHHRGHRRRRKHCRSSRHSADEVDHIGHSSGRRVKCFESRVGEGVSSSSRRLLDGTNHSDTELACRQGQDMADTNSIDRIIKFGSMPSYKEDKLKQKKHHAERNIEDTPVGRKQFINESGSTRSAPQSPPPQSSGQTTIAMVSVATECTPASIAGCTLPQPMMNGNWTAVPMESPTRKSLLSSPLTLATCGARLTTYNTAIVSNAPPPLFPHTTADEPLASFCDATVGMVTDNSQAYGSYTRGAHQTDPSQGISATAALIGAGKAGAAAALAAAAVTTSSETPTTMSVNSALPVAVSVRDQARSRPQPSPDALHNSEGMSDIQFSIVMENSWRQPEKGILKNKNEVVCLATGTNTTATVTSTSGFGVMRKSKSKKSGDGHRHRDHSHRHRRRKGSRNRISDDVEGDCCSLYSECSCGLADDGKKRRGRDRSCSIPSRSHGRHNTRHHSLVGSEASLRSSNSLSSAREANRSASSSGSSRTGLSLSSQSSCSSSSFSDADGVDRDALGGDMLLSSSSTSSTCSTALEVCPGGRIGRSVSQTDGSQRVDGEAELHRESHQRSSHRSRETCSHRHHHHNHNHSRRQYARGHHSRKRHMYGSENGVPSMPGVGASSSVEPGGSLGPESSGSSLSRTTTACGLSTGSSSSSGLAPGTTHTHRRHRRVRGRRSTDEDATTSGSHRSSPVPSVPTILCNAGQQTDEISLLKATGMIISSKKDGAKAASKSSSLRGEESEGEWEEVECSESACEECQAAGVATSLTSATTTVITATTTIATITTNSDCIRGRSLELGQISSVSQSATFGLQPPKLFDTTPHLVGHTNAAYIPSMRPTVGEANMSNNSIAYQQQSTASSSLGSSKNSRISTPAPMVLMPNQGALFPVGTQLPHGNVVGVGTVKGGGSGVTNRAASSSSCSSSSVTGQNPGFHRPLASQNKSGPEEFPNQHSEPEVDAHLHHAQPARFGQFYTSLCAGTTGVVQIPMQQQQHQNATGLAVINPTSTAPYNLIPTPHFLPPPPPPPASHPSSGLLPGQSRPYPANRGAPPYSEMSSFTNQNGQQALRQLLPQGPRSMNFSDQNETYYQHPYEEVATDDYAEATSHSRTDSLYPNHHIYHQHGLPVINQGSNGDLSNGCVYEKGDDDDERLSLDEGHSGLGSIGPSPLVNRYNMSGGAAAPLLMNYAHLSAQDPRLGPQSQQWLDSPGMSGNVTKHGMMQADPVNHQRDSKSASGMTDAEDEESEFSLSAFRRDDIRIPHYPSSGTGAGGVGLSASHGGLLKATHLRHLNVTDAHNSSSMRGSSELGTDVHSNDGTCDESDTSSLPEAGCDLVQLAQLDVSGRPNPLLNDLARQQANSRRWMPHTTTTGVNQPLSSQNSSGYEACAGRSSTHPYVMNSDGMNGSPHGTHRHPGTTTITMDAQQQH